jgi:peptidoglycan/LPS O-acetylase OafA/YrhL
MLRPRQTGLDAGPAPVWLGLSLLALALLMSAANIWAGAHATPREAVIYTILAGVGLVMLWNLNRTRPAARRRSPPVRRAGRQAMEASGPPAKYPWERAS